MSCVICNEILHHMCEPRNNYKPSLSSWHELLTQVYLWTNHLCISHINILVHLGCHSITKTRQGPFTKVRCSLMEPFGLTRVLFSRMLCWFRICISICSLFYNSLRTALKCALRKVYLMFWILRRTLFVRLPCLVESFELISHSSLAFLNVLWLDLPLSFGSGIGC
jgi:hypothetical protein